MTGRVARRVGLLAVGVLAAAVTRNPTRFRLGHRTGVVHVVSFRTLCGAAALGGALVAGAGRRRISRHGRPVGGTVAAVVDAAVAVAGGVAAGNAVALAGQGWAGRSVRGAGRPSTERSADVVVLLLNALMGAADADAIVRRAVERDATMLALPECSAALARAVVDGLAAHGRRVQAFGTRENLWPTGETWLLVDERLGRYRQVPAPAMQLGAAIAEPDGHDGPTLAAVHPPAPMTLVGLAAWRRFVAVAVDVARSRPDAIVAGDFNTTLDHAPMADLTPYVDAATVVGRGAEGTWPARFPALLATPIDHVLVRPDRWTVLGTRTYRVGDSDHRAVVARLSRVPRSWPAVPR